MVAVAHARPADVRRLVVVRTTPMVRPVPGRLPAAIYRRRRVVAALLVAAVVAAIVLASQVLLAPVAGPIASSRSAGSSSVDAPVHVVQPGDTFWDIARALRPGDDPRPLVARLIAAHGSPVLVVGERIPLPTGH